jgi:hypothetical protein
MRSSSGYALLEGFCHLFKRLANEPVPFPTDVNNLLARFAGDHHRAEHAPHTPGCNIAEKASGGAAGAPPRRRAGGLLLST